MTTTDYVVIPLINSNYIAPQDYREQDWGTQTETPDPTSEKFGMGDHVCDSPCMPKFKMITSLGHPFKYVTLLLFLFFISPVH